MMVVLALVIVAVGLLLLWLSFVAMMGGFGMASFIITFIALGVGAFGVILLIPAVSNWLPPDTNGGRR